MQIVLLDYERGRIVGRKVPEGMDAEEAAQKLADSIGVSLDDCNWMSGKLFGDLNFISTNGIDRPYIRTGAKPEQTTGSK